MIDHPELYTFWTSPRTTPSGAGPLGPHVAGPLVVEDRPRPINNNKIYSGGDDEEAVARMFRIIFAGGPVPAFIVRIPWKEPTITRSPHSGDWV
jgi:hypothetical protein